ncbi:MAG: hypothetical protein DRR16_20705 [Candidatus Parabeggiatoa sp. nov. 3]|nr:MAG: hypothetical protein DRR00_07545 [Gammaproteobacteria bacterium]RKZ67144.1 MAG: hypothetical protein DRQ99_07595 [Gammaproteobacteria bacterium]RKZ82040.1 MAG: hypothetical protein DRR16_20705 [Gammaproteobacteria bacterium]
MKLYRYVGPNDLRELVSSENCGTPIQRREDILNWLKSNRSKIPYYDDVMTTFIINTDGLLCLADRHSEHLVCAFGGAVLSAGEMRFLMTGDQVEVIEVTNQSTGYCPEPESWPTVAQALDQLGLSHPNGFSHEFVFRRCLNCQAINIIKEKWFFCAICTSPLSQFWNLDEITLV